MIWVWLCIQLGQQEPEEEELKIHQWQVDKFRHMHLLELMELVQYIQMLMVHPDMTAQTNHMRI